MIGETIELIEKEGVSRRLLDALKEFSHEDGRLTAAMKRFNLL